MTDADSGTILILDDDEIVTRTLEAVLTLETSWGVHLFNRPSDALASLEQRTYHAVVSDFLMPEMDGVKFLAQIKERQPVASRVLLTGYADKQNAIRSINEVGLYHYLEKPWENDTLLMVLRNALERAKLFIELNEKMEKLAKTDRSLEQMRSRLLKAIL